MSVPHAKLDDLRNRAKRNAWLLALAAAGIYAAMIVWYLTGGAA